MERIRRNDVDAKATAVSESLRGLYVAVQGRNGYYGLDLFDGDGMIDTLICGTLREVDTYLNGMTRALYIVGRDVSYLRHETTSDYGTEVVIDTPNGMQLRADGEDLTGTSYIRICDQKGREVAYWISDEWREAPEEVMGAIIGALCVY